MLAFPNPLDPIVEVLTWLLTSITAYTHNFGWTLVLWAALLKAALWPLTTMQYKSMVKFQSAQKIMQPQIKAIQAKHKSDPAQVNAETMALYKEYNVNPFGSCLPALIPFPILISVYWAINAKRDLFSSTGFAWIGTGVSHAFPAVLATSLAQVDYVLLVLYAASMYFSIRYSSPAIDPQQAQQQQIMALVSPLMLFWIGRFWPSAFVLYWLMFNIFTMAQQFYLMRKYPRDAVAAALFGSAPSPVPVTDVGPSPKAVVAPAKNGSTRSSRRKRTRR